MDYGLLTIDPESFRGGYPQLELFILFLPCPSYS